MEEMISLTFTAEHKYQLEFTPPEFWREFAEGYCGIPWMEISSDRTAIVAVNYSYLLDLLVQARLYRLSRLPSGSQLK
ncbi:MAG TPA: hypothetical protein PLY52_02260 [Methanothrix sp.]|jgi:hypothetical protein|uniref:hypothetical protein n=2 Tax=Methanothrix sp. TaxID=90426 RepID=UPI002C3EF961|nr:hypothetical protein [Methanothrix sp.]MDI9418324.1 hypothetical protein [Euryarchaeota archaeon]HON35118.1 hypothetical protein [Methanothrix sp.]HRU74706.1 hypothetical protein [Methanothrix sp.]